MPFEHDPKTLAKRLRTALKSRDIDLSHSQTLEIVAQQLGFTDWNTASALLTPPTLQIPKDWLLSGANPKDYDVGVDPAHPAHGAMIRARDIEPKQGGFATLMQSVSAKPYIGHRLRFQAELRCRDVVGAATIWMRMDGPSDGSIRFDNMERRTVEGPLHGTQDWETRAIVLHVPPEVQSVHYGFYLRGTGQCWARAFAIESVGQDVEITSKTGPYLLEPSNLGLAT